MTETTSPSSTSVQPKLGFVRMRDTSRVLEGATAYSRVVGLLRWVLPVSVLALFAALLIWPMVGRHKLAATVAQAVPNLVVENLRMTGVDKNDEPYLLTAKRALQVQDSKAMIDLEHPQGELTLNSGAWLAGKANFGRFDQDSTLR